MHKNNADTAFSCHERAVQSRSGNVFVVSLLLRQTILRLFFAKPFLWPSVIMGVNDEYDPKELDDLLPAYYRRLFPSRKLHEGLSYGNPDGECHFNCVLD